MRNPKFPTGRKIPGLGFRLFQADRDFQDLGCSLKVLRVRNPPFPAQRKIPGLGFRLSQADGADFQALGCILLGEGVSASP